MGETTEGKGIASDALWWLNCNPAIATETAAGGRALQDPRGRAQVAILRALDYTGLGLVASVKLPISG